MIVFFTGTCQNMHYQRHDDFGKQSPAGGRLRDRRIDDQYLMSGSPRSRRSLSPLRRVLGRDRRSNLERRDYSWDLSGRRGDRIRSSSPPLEQVGKRPNYGSSRKDSPLAGMHRRYDIYEYMDMNADADANAGLMKEFEYIHNTSRVIREDLDGMLGQQPMGLEDGTGQGMYRLPTDMGPTSKNNKPGGNMSSASVKMGLDSFKDNRVQYSDPLLPEKFSVMEQYDKGEKPMFHSRDAPYTTVPASQSKDFMANSQFKDFASTSSGKLRTNFGKPYWDGVPLPADDYFGVSVKPTERMGFSGYGERHDLGSGRNSEVDDRREPFSPTGDEHHNYMYNRAVLGESDILDIGRDPKAEGKNQTFYKRDTFSPTRTDRRDYLYPRLGVRETDDYPSDEVYRRMSERIDYDSRPNMGPVTEHYGTTEFGRRNLTHSSLWNHPSLEKQPFPNQVGMRRSSTASKEVRQYLNSVTAHVEFGRKVSREEEIPYLGNSKDRDMMLPMISNYSLGRDAGPIYHKERMRRSPEFQHETEMRRLSVRNLGIKGEEYGTYNPSNRVPKRKYSTDEEMDWHDPRNIMSTKWNSSSRTQDLDDRGEEWIGQQRSSYLSKRAACGRENNRRAERIFDRTDELRVSAYEDRSSSHEPAEHVLGHSMKPHKSGDRYFKGNSKPGSQSWYSSYHYSRKNVLPKPNNVWIRSKDGNQGDVHAKKVEQSENWAISAKSELTEDSDEFKQLVHSYFLSFTRKLNDNPAVRKRYKEQGRAGSLFCIVCGRSESKEFTDTQRLATHAFMSHKHGLRAQHLGLHKAICVLLGWNSVVAPDVVTWYPETILNAEALAQKEDLIIWPPVIVIHNSSTSGHDSERQRGITVEALEDFLRGKGVSGGKVKIGNPANHSIMLVKFLGTFSGLQDAEKLQKYFTENKRGRIDFEKIAFGKGKSSKSGEGKKGGELDELVLYGYMGIAEDLDQIDYDTKRKCSIKSKKEIQDIADAPVKPE